MRSARGTIAILLAIAVCAWLVDARLAARIDASARATRASLAKVVARPTPRVAFRAPACSPAQRQPGYGSEEPTATATEASQAPGFADEDVDTDAVESQSLAIIDRARSAGEWTQQDDLELLRVSSALPRAAHERVQQELAQAVMQMN